MTSSLATKEGTVRDGNAIPRLKDRLLRDWGDLAAVEGNLIAAGGQTTRTLMVISGSPGEGRTSAAACLGLALAGAGRTLLVDAHLRKPDMSSLFTEPGAPGLSEVLLDGLDVASALYPTADAETLFILPAGQRLTSPSALFRSPAFFHLIAALRQDWDYVMCDTPPFLVESDASLMAGQFDAAVLVVSCEDTRWEVARLVAERLDVAGGRLIGAVLNRRRYYIPGAIYRSL